MPVCKANSATLMPSSETGATFYVTVEECLTEEKSYSFGTVYLVAAAVAA